MTDRLEGIQHIAIIRGVTPDRAVQVTEAFFEAGFRAIEVPLNSPEPLVSIGKMVDAFGDQMLVGAGTVLSPEAVDQVANTGAQLLVSPNTNSAVIGRAKERGMVSLPGVLTPSECFNALDAGADALKVFPASSIGFSGVNMLTHVMPPGTKLFAVGGVSAGNVQQWMDAGCAGVAAARNCFTPEMSIDEIRDAASAFVRA
jgi:2-dehydro-3-deoxyphosphogalactonate aldolase